MYGYFTTLSPKLCIDEYGHEFIQDIRSKLIEKAEQVILITEEKKLSGAKHWHIYWRLNLAKAGRVSAQVKKWFVKFGFPMDTFQPGKTICSEFAYDIDGCINYCMKDIRELPCLTLIYHDGISPAQLEAGVRYKHQKKTAPVLPVRNNYVRPKRRLPIWNKSDIDEKLISYIDDRHDGQMPHTYEGFVHLWYEVSEEYSLWRLERFKKDIFRGLLCYYHRPETAYIDFLSRDM